MKIESLHGKGQRERKRDDKPRRRLVEAIANRRAPARFLPHWLHIDWFSFASSCVLSDIRQIATG
jgi:hypothetical protein